MGGNSVRLRIPDDGVDFKLKAKNVIGADPFSIRSVIDLIIRLLPEFGSSDSYYVMKGRFSVKIR